MTVARHGGFIVSVSWSTPCACHSIPMYFDHFLYVHDDNGDFTVFDCFPSFD